jgi:hypothetical protein
MGSGTIAPWLKEYASAVPPEQAIVEVGAWLGCGTQFLVRMNGELFSYDRFRASQSEVWKAKAFGVHLTVGQNTLPWVQSHLPEGIHFIRGEIMKAAYDGPKIGMYVDDASKQGKVWHHSMKVFEPHFASGTIIVLMDYWFRPCSAQRLYARKWQVVEERLPGTSGAVFVR